MDIDIKYIEDNFIELNELCKISEISSQEINALIENELIPNSSYEINTTYKINSPLGDQKTISEVKKYYPKSVIALIQKNKKLNDSSEFKKSLKTAFTNTFVNNNNNRFGYDNITEEDGTVNIDKLNSAFEQEWQYYLQGIYGICTLNATGAEIAKKEIAVKRLIDFNEKHGAEKLSDSNKKILTLLNNEFNEVSNLFAPYQRVKSSRGKYLDQILESNSLSDLIKKYN
ncbi:hypothetical protein CXF68_18720 [Tenacibaculum sp. Bg11-29]|uniref:DUF6058 family natural product biosynthesis protein n=1 Tax=Tenacibaculum sp. Bg11-29 TaxID=2058306 RepID=UPI000C34F34D|nr:DUF6058 family natural product biosynthesis protein [Tenacibaculum sp. Bg11-29]PKH52609.1 hypothetical protein CXF68_18720 [Tenacibaculum sp. Bg11-29]